MKSVYSRTMMERMCGCRASRRQTEHNLTGRTRSKEHAEPVNPRAHWNGTVPVSTEFRIWRCLKATSAASCETGISSSTFLLKAHTIHFLFSALSTVRAAASNPDHAMNGTRHEASLMRPCDPLLIRKKTETTKSYTQATCNVSLIESSGA